MEEKNLINCLRNEKVIVRYIKKKNFRIDNPRHVLHGGMAETAKRTFVVPRLTSGRYVNVLTDDEKDFFEEQLGLEKNALSIYKREDNFWDDDREDTICKVVLTKQDTYLDLSDPGDYIRYKILLANKDLIAPSLEALEELPKATYQFVIISEGEELKSLKDNTNIVMKCYKEFGKVEEDYHILKFIVESIDSRPIAKSTKIEFLQSKINDLIKSDPKVFYKIITDPYLGSKVLLVKAVDAGIVSKKGDFLYLREDNKPLCEDGQEPNLEMAARYINMPKHQAIKLAIEAELKK